jgi:hypothetical protein
MFKKLKVETIDSFIGRPFFYADKETGTGWKSKVDSIHRDVIHDSYTLELSCGTLVKMDRLELLKFRYEPTLTNVKESNV